MATKKKPLKSKPTVKKQAKGSTKTAAKSKSRAKASPKSKTVSSWMGTLALSSCFKAGATKKVLDSCDAKVVFTTDAQSLKAPKLGLGGWSKKKWTNLLGSGVATADIATVFPAAEPVFIVQVGDTDSQGFQSATSRWRDSAAKWLTWCLRSGFERVELDLAALSAAQQQAVLLSIEMGLYRFRVSNVKGPAFPSFFTASNVDKDTLSSAEAVGQSVNWARELVNLPPADLQPTSYAALCKSWFAKYKGIKVEVWDEARLKKEKCGLHVAVGQAADHTSKLVKISYRPSTKTSNRKKQAKHFAFVGKGITFDTGGMDLKPAAGMRYMKKDMGGSAAVFGLANYVALKKPKQSYDFYLALAENSVAADAFHPSDILQAHNGKTVEIHNTDAEGRLVLADAMSVAQSAAKLDGLIDVGTLTGAMRVAVGLDIIGVCSNRGKLGAAAMRAGYVSGDPSWQLPLFPAYNSMLHSEFADISNCPHARYAGGITAALFLQHFVSEDTPWLHMDMNAFGHSPKGACLQTGGNGQGVQMLAELVETWCESLS